MAGMNMDPALNEIDGAAELERWFGYWPSFHDAEVVSVSLNRVGVSTVVVHTWDITKYAAKRDGKSVVDKSILVELSFEQITDLSLEDFSVQNVLGELKFRKTPTGFRLELRPLFGIGGYIEAQAIRIKFHPGSPSDYPDR
jgi:Immunity protein 50